jgi:hypothetical protein
MHSATGLTGDDWHPPAPCAR